MKVLVTGTKGKFVSYFRQYVSRHKSEWTFNYISLKDGKWKEYDFSSYDTIIHCAGITQAQDDDYKIFRRINVDLTRELCNKVIEHGCKQFIYLSSMAVYDGVGWGFDESGLIKADTDPVQCTNYGRSKYEAEKAINELTQNHDAHTKISIVRAPSIVGADLESYFDRYIKFARIPFVPIPWIHAEAKRSIVYVDTLIEFICNLAKNGDVGGVYYPHNIPQLSVSEMMLEVSKAMGKSKRSSTLFGRLLPPSIQNRFFSQISYDDSMSEKENHDVSEISSREAIWRVIKGI